MMQPGAEQATGRARWSLERRLGLLILALLVGVMAIIGFAAYREVRASALSRAADRLERVARELAGTSARGAQPRLATLQALGRNPAIVATVREASVDATPDRPPAMGVGGRAPLSGAAAARVLAALAGAAQPNDSTLLGWELWGADGVRLYAATVPGARDSSALATLRVATLQGRTVQRSPMFVAGEQIHFWTAIPVLADGRQIGVLAEHRRLGNSQQAEQTIRELVGEEVYVLFTSVGSREWASLRGTPAAAPFTDTILDDSATVVRGADGARLFAVQTTVPGTPWRIVLLQPQGLVLERARTFLRRLLIVGAALLLAGMVAAWLLGRHVAGPLRRVTDAAAALAGGDYSQRVPITGAREVAGLAATFNQMASSLGDAHAALAEQNAALQRANAAKEEFLAMMSHELRTPLNAIGGYAELMELGVRGPVSPQQAQDLARIRRNKDHLLSIIGDMLSVSRSDDGGVVLDLVDLPAAAVIGHAVDAMSPLYAARHVRLVVEPPARDVFVHADQERVQQVLLNLLANALKFTDPGGDVTLACIANEAEVQFTVRDTGIGIPEERLEQIFEPFVQVDSSLTRRAGGAGLGLAIARRLAGAMNGTVTVQSELGRGSTFTFTLPRARPAATSHASRRGAGSGAPAV